MVTGDVIHWVQGAHMTSLYRQFLRSFLLPLGDVVTRQNVMQLYRFYDEAQWWSPDRLREFQERALREVVRESFDQVPLYRRLYTEAGIQPSDVTETGHLERLPVINKDLLRSSYPDDCVRRTGRPTTEFFTSGSSGQPFAVTVDNQTLSHARALMLLRARFSGWEFGDPYLQTGMSLDRGSVKRTKDRLLRCHYRSAFDLSDDALDRFLDLLESRGLKYVMGYPGSIYFLALRAQAVGFNRQLRGVVTWGDNLYPHYRKSIEKTFACRVTDTYGVGEGIQVAAQCSDGGYHVFMPHVIVEIVRDDNKTVKSGEAGNILLTRLDTGAMPLIRYRVGDLGRKKPLAQCACGRGLEMLESIDGRDTDVVVTPNGNRLIVHFFTGIFEYYPSISTFRVVQETIQDLRIEIVPTPGFTKAEWSRIKTEILEKGDSDLNLRLEIVKSIPLPSSGKRRFIVSEMH